MPVQQYTIGHTGSVLDPNDEGGIVTLEQNQVSPQRETPVATFKCPDNFDSISFVGNRDATRFVPRYKDTYDGTGSKTTFSVSGDLIPVVGETAIEEQPYPVVVAVADGSEATIASVDYNANEVTLDSAPSNGTDNVHLFPVVATGTVKIRGLNTLDQPTQPIYPWAFPIYRWHDLRQGKRGTEINLNGSLRWDRDEKMQVMVDSPRQIVWDDSDYPDAYVSALEIDVEIQH